MNGNGVVVLGVIFLTPDKLEQFLGADDLASACAKNMKDGKLGFRKYQRLFVSRSIVT